MYLLSASHGLYWSLNGHDNAASTLQLRTLSTEGLRDLPRPHGQKGRSYDENPGSLAGGPERMSTLQTTLKLNAASPEDWTRCYFLVWTAGAVVCGHGQRLPFNARATVTEAGGSHVQTHGRTGRCTQAGSPHLTLTVARHGYWTKNRSAFVLTLLPLFPRPPRFPGVELAPQTANLQPKPNSWGTFQWIKSTPWVAQPGTPAAESETAARGRAVRYWILALPDHFLPEMTSYSKVITSALIRKALPWNSVTNTHAGAHRGDVPVDAVFCSLGRFACPCASESILITKLCNKSRCLVM